MPLELLQAHRAPLRANPGSANSDGERWCAADLVTLQTPDTSPHGALA